VSQTQLDLEEEISEAYFKGGFNHQIKEKEWQKYKNKTSNLTVRSKISLNKKLTFKKHMTKEK